MVIIAQQLKVIVTLTKYEVLFASRLAREHQRYSLTESEQTTGAVMRVSEL